MKTLRFYMAVASFFATAFLTNCSDDLELISANTEVFHSQAADDDYKLYITVPKNYNPNESYPVVFYLDGDWYYEFFQNEVDELIESNKIPPCIVVGIGYPLDGGYKDVCPKCKYKEDEININRVRDYTFPADTTFKVPTGMAPLFTEFLNDDLIPKMEADYSTDSSQYYLLGHSIGGIGIFYNLFQHPNTKFDGFAALSSSIWWQGGHTFSLEEEYNQNYSDLDTKLYISYGTAESGSLAVHNAEMIDRIKSRNYPSLQLKTSILKGASHRQVAWDGFRNGMIYLLNE
ncbi:MAG: alpha/beta hydrolase-fold protein [Marinoscillum sp.]